MFVVVLADVIKTRYMSDITNKYNNPLHCFLLTYKEGGVPIFFKVYFIMYSYCALFYVYVN
jgi:hypothetical protein